MKTSANGLTLIETSEGFRNLPYQDCGGVWTVGYGHVIKPMENFSGGITEDQGRMILMGDVGTAEYYVNMHARQANQNQFDALVDFTFNLGQGALQTMLAHGWQEIPQQMVRWCDVH